MIPLTVGSPAHGGHCVARHDGRVVFVRHALPGERITAEVTEVRRGYLRADAVEILEGSPDRVTPPCPYARPGGCGGCDLQHVAPLAQREWKAAVVTEQLRRLGGLTEAEVSALGVAVTPLPGGLLDWRTRVRYAIDGAGRAGLRVHRSHQVVPIDRCRIAHPRVQAQEVTSRRWSATDQVEVAVGVDETVAIRPDVRAPDVPVPDVPAPDPVRVSALGREWRLPPEVFWQVHPEAADTLAAAVIDLLNPRPQETAWDLYGGAGLFSAALAAHGCEVTLVESSSPAVATARTALADLTGLVVVDARVEAALRRGRLPGPVDLVVLDPPRAGAGAAVVRAIVAATPRAVAYVACDPAAFARDLRTFREHGWTLAELRGYDCFPMTQHVELVALLHP